jgi:hypothetical protein
MKGGLQSKIICPSCTSEFRWYKGVTRLNWFTDFQINSEICGQMFLRPFPALQNQVAFHNFSGFVLEQ